MIAQRAKNLWNCVAGLVCMALFASCSPALPAGAGLNWPGNQLFPSFDHFEQIQVVDATLGMSNDDLNTIVSLQGLINRQKPLIYVKHVAEEDPDTWLNSLATEAKLIPIADPWTLFKMYRTEIAGVAIYDPEQPDTINLATTLAGIEGGVIASPEVAARLVKSPYNLKLLADFREYHFASRAETYQWAYDNYWSKTTHRLIVGLDPGISGYMRDYVIALNAMIIWLDPRHPDEQEILSKFLSDMPVSSSFIGYFPEPENGGEVVHVKYLSEHGHPVFATNYMQNMTVWGGTSRDVAVPTIPPPPNLENKIYVAFILSDGDNMQYDQHRMRVYWDDPHRGQVPIGWTFDAAMMDVAPHILRFYRETSSPLDTLIAGPSGVGYTYPNYWPAQESLHIYTRQSNAYLEKTGMRVVTIWDAAGQGFTTEAADAYASEMPYLFGITHQNWTMPNLINNRLMETGLHPSLADGEVVLLNTIRSMTRASGWYPDEPGQEPAFIAAQANVWLVSPTNLYNVMQTLQAENPNYEFIRIDHYFMLLRQANGLPVDLP